MRAVADCAGSLDFGEPGVNSAVEATMAERR